MRRIAIYIVPLVMAIASFLYIENKNKLQISTKRVFAVLMMTCAMFINFGSNAFNPKNTVYETFQADSEELVTNMLNAKKAGVTDTGAYGLGYFDAETKTVENYVSQYGLQGKIFQMFYKLPIHHIVCCLLTSFVFSLIVFLVYKKYDGLLAFVFFITFLLSQWTVNYAKNLYWVEFMWFVPMLLGVAISFDYKSLKKKTLCYAGIFFAILIKCLCGYEYITVIMLAEVAFPLIDLFVSLIEKDKKKSVLIFRTIFVMGVVSVAGFVLALLIHANLRGEGNIIEGLKSIYDQDVLRRTLGGHFENFTYRDTSDLFKASFEASIPKVFILYQFFNTEIISGISGKLFVLIEFLPLLIFIYRFREGRLNKKDVIAYFVFGVTCVSWFILGKSHSYIHTPLNFVLWYFGFVQICFYVILKQVIQICKYVIKNREDIERKLLEQADD